jgi:hypothetical protein
MNFRIDMFVGERHLMIVSFHRTRLEASLKVAEYALEDRENGRDCYRYEVCEV